jgi:hypothetical protein
MFRIELDRLIEQSPSIPDSIISSFKQEFRMLADVKRPEVTGAIEHTRTFDNKNARLKAVAAEAALILSHKKRFLKEIALDELDARVRAIIAGEEVKSQGTKAGSGSGQNKISENLPGQITIDVEDDEEGHKRQYDKT